MKELGILKKKSTNDIITKLNDLSRLREINMLTEDEFQRAKDKLLSVKAAAITESEGGKRGRETLPKARTNKQTLVSPPPPMGGRARHQSPLPPSPIVTADICDRVTGAPPPPPPPPPPAPSVIGNRISFGKVILEPLDIQYQNTPLNHNKESSNDDWGYGRSIKQQVVESVRNHIQQSHSRSASPASRENHSSAVIAIPPSPKEEILSRNTYSSYLRVPSHTPTEDRSLEEMIHVAQAHAAQAVITNHLKSLSPINPTLVGEHAAVQALSDVRYSSCTSIPESGCIDLRNYGLTGSVTNLFNTNKDTHPVSDVPVATSEIVINNLNSFSPTNPTLGGEHTADMRYSSSTSIPESGCIDLRNYGLGGSMINVVPAATAEKISSRPAFQSDIKNPPTLRPVLPVNVDKLLAASIEFEKSARSGRMKQQQHRRQ